MSGNWRSVQRIVLGQETSDGAGVRLRRMIGTPELRNLDPFLMLDAFGSDAASDYIAGFPDHPHRGMETVTYMLAGRMRHADNKGNGGVLGPGGVQWMTAGRGIVHSEMPEQEEGEMRGFQLWVNLPARDKMTAPRYQNIEPEEIPEATTAEGVQLRIVAGSYAGQEGPVRAVAAEPIYLDATLPAGAAFELPIPEGHNAFVHVFQGGLSVAGERESPEIPAGALAVLGPGDGLRLTAGAEGGRALIVAGRPFNEPIVQYGPFVMNSQEQIVQAFRDYEMGRF